MEFVGSRLDVDVDCAAQTAPELGRQQVALHFELGDRIGARQNRRLVVVRGVVVDSIEQKIIILDSVAVDADQKILIERIVSLRNVGAGRQRD